MRKLVLLYSWMVGTFFVIIWTLSTTASSHRLPLFNDQNKAVLFCSGAGSPSHVRPLLEYGLTLKERGHRVTLALIQDFLPTAIPYELDNFVISNQTNPLSLSHNIAIAMRDGFGLRPMLENTIPIVAQFDALLYKTLEQWFIGKNASNNLPNVVVGDVASSVCHDLAKKFHIPSIITSHFLSVGGGYRPSSVNFRVHFEPTSLLQVPLWKRFQRLVWDYLANMLPFIRLKKEIAELKIKWDLPSQSLSFFSLFPKLPLLGNTFFPFNPVATYPVHYQAVGPIMPRFYPGIPMDILEVLDRLALQNKKVVLLGFGYLTILDEDTIETLWQGLVRVLDLGLLDQVYWGAGKSLKGLKKYSDSRITVLAWSPQFSMLQHKALSLFITHAGVESSHEGMFCGVPMIAIPMFGDQAGNSMRIQELGIGIAISRNELTTGRLVAAIVEVIKDRTGKFHRNIQRIKEVAKRASKNGLLAAVDTIETVAAIGTDYMFPKTQ